MLSIIKGNLDRQAKGVLLLRTLLEEEFSLLKQGDAQCVTRIELSIQELMRQLMVERISLKSRVRSVNQGAKRLADLYEVMPAEAADFIRAKLRDIDNLEQECARQADRNRMLALAFHEQSTSMIKFIHDRIVPKNENTYSRRGRYAHIAPQAALLSGRF